MKKKGQMRLMKKKMRKTKTKDKREREREIREFRWEGEVERI
jgi:hypothetical protein